MLNTEQSTDLKLLIARQTIANQSKVLVVYKKPTPRSFMRIVKEAQTGDALNCLVPAARMYFPALFNRFKRHQDKQLTQTLEQGYQLISVVLDKAVEQENTTEEYSTYRYALLANFQPIVDAWLHDRLSVYEDVPETLSADDELYIKQILDLEISIAGEKTSVQNALQISAASLMKTINSNAVSELHLPHILLPPRLSD